jgi:hypothetical protein
MEDNDEKNSLKSCLEESNNPRMKNYVKILDTPNITTFEWIHRTQEELMDGIVYLEKLKDILSTNMRELDAARMASKESEKVDRETETIHVHEEENVEAEPKTVIKKKKPKVKTGLEGEEKKKKLKIKNKDESKE